MGLHVQSRLCLASTKGVSERLQVFRKMKLNLGRKT
jgi:hypothetical protein